MMSRHGGTGVVYDEQMLEHCCLWEDHPERPERLTSVLHRCKELGLLDRCARLPTRLATESEIKSVHSQEQYAKLAKVCADTESENCNRLESLKEFSSRYDSVYVHPATFHAARLSCGSTVELVQNILQGEIRNGMAIVRPPGHHAMTDEYCGYSFFNNVAVAAHQALDLGLATRILIVDFDVHHGQGTQQAFYDDPRVLYFSTHRYEFGTFWPHLRESDFNWTGHAAAAGFSCNVPLNAVGMGDTEFLTVWHQLLLPIAQQFRPELVLVSAGFDSALSDPKGEMRITPQCYAHLVAPLMGLAEGRVALVLEGGYCLKALAEGAALCLRTLLCDPCPRLPLPIGRPMPELVDSVLNCMTVLQDHWAFPINKWNGNADAEDLPLLRHIPRVKYNWVEQPKPERYPISDSSPVSTFEGGEGPAEIELQGLIENMDLRVPEFKIGGVGSESCSSHQEKGCGETRHKASSLQALIRDVVNGICQLGVYSRGATDSDFSLISALEEISTYALDNLHVGRLMQLTIAIGADGTRPSSSLSPSSTAEEDERILQFVLTSCSNEVEPTGKNFIRLAVKDLLAEDGKLLTLCTSLVLPIAYEFGPELVLLSLNINQDDQDHEILVQNQLRALVHLLRPLAGGKMVILAQQIRNPFLLGGDSPPSAFSFNVNYGCEELCCSLNEFAKHWTVLEPFRKRIPAASGSGVEIGTYKTPTVHLQILPENKLQLLSQVLEARLPVSARLYNVLRLHKDGRLDPIHPVTFFALGDIESANQMVYFCTQYVGSYHVYTFCEPPAQQQNKQDTVTVDADAMARALEPHVDWSELNKFGAVSLSLADAIAQMCAARGSQMLSYPCKIYATLGNELSHVQVPENSKIRPLSVIDLDKVARFWKFTTEKTKAMMRECLVQVGCSFGLYVGKTLASWVLLNRTGNFFALQTDPVFAGHRFGEAVLRAACKAAIDRGLVSVTIVESYNETAMRVMKRVGLKHVQDVQWIQTD